LYEKIYLPHLLTIVKSCGKNDFLFLTITRCAFIITHHQSKKGAIMKAQFFQVVGVLLLGCFFGALAQDYDPDVKTAVSWG